MNTSAIKSRQYYIDWLRVVAIFLVFVYHSLRPFASEGYHINNAQTYPFIDVITGILPIFGMPLVFLISGASAYYALGKRSSGRYVWDRSLRLVVPFVVGMLTYIPLLVYLERVSHGDFVGSFPAFMGTYFDGLYAFGGDFAWMGLHLWYLALLFIFTLLLLPPMAWLRHTAAGERALAGFSHFLARPGMVYLLAVPLILLGLLLDPNTPWGARQLGGWTIFEYLLIFFFGFFLVGEPLPAAIQRQRWPSLAVGLLALVGGSVMRLTQDGLAFGTTAYALYAILLAVCAWCLMLAVWGFSRVYLNFGNLTLYLANEAVLPFYIMHQTFIVILGFYVITWPLPDLAKWLVITLGTLALMSLIHFGLIRRSNVLRFLFGLPPRPAPEALRPAEAGG